MKSRFFENDYFSKLYSEKKSSDKKSTSIKKSPKIHKKIFIRKNI